MGLALATLWLAVGIFAVASAQRYRHYIDALPGTAGNRSIKRQRIAILVFGVVGVLGGLWRLAIALRITTP